jgi:hypothetical protein
LTIDRLDESVRDCDMAIELNKNFVKVRLDDRTNAVYSDF